MSEHTLQEKETIFSILAEDKMVVAYRPSIAKSIGSVAGAILLQQIFHHWYNNGREPFYKYKKPCDATDYKDGDSWCEELGLSRSEFDVALKKIGQKVSQKTKKNNTALVWYWIRPDRRTYYEINEKAFTNLILARKAGSSFTTGRILPYDKQDPALDNSSKTYSKTYSKKKKYKGSSSQKSPTRQRMVLVNLLDKKQVEETLSADIEPQNATPVSILMREYALIYQEVYQKPHPRLKAEQVIGCGVTIMNSYLDFDINSRDDCVSVIRQHFRRDDLTDGNINAFTSGMMCCAAIDIGLVDWVDVNGTGFDD